MSVAPSCTLTNQDHEPDSDARGTAPCLKPLPQTVSSTLAAGQTDASKNDLRDVYVVDGRAGKWLHAHTEAGDAPEVGDTLGSEGLSVGGAVAGVATPGCPSVLKPEVLVTRFQEPMKGSEKVPFGSWTTCWMDSEPNSRPTCVTPESSMLNLSAATKPKLSCVRR